MIRLVWQLRQSTVRLNKQDPDLRHQDFPQSLLLWWYPARTAATEDTHKPERLSPQATRSSGLSLSSVADTPRHFTWLSFSIWVMHSLWVYHVFYLDLILHPAAVVYRRVSATEGKFKPEFRVAFGDQALRLKFSFRCCCVWWGFAIGEAVLLVGFAFGNWYFLRLPYPPKWFFLQKPVLQITCLVACVNA